MRTFLARPTRNPPQETLVALIDVVFFLLVFALLAGRMDATAPFDLTPPEATSAEDLPGGRIFVALSGDGRLAFEGEPVSREALQRLVVQRQANSPKMSISINADRAAPIGALMQLRRDLATLGARDVVLVVERGGSG